MYVYTHTCVPTNEVKAALDEQYYRMYTSNNQGKRSKHEKFHEVDIWWIIEAHTVDVEICSSSFKVINVLVYLILRVWEPHTSYTNWYY